MVNGTVVVVVVVGAFTSLSLSLSLSCLRSSYRRSVANDDYIEATQPREDVHCLTYFMHHLGYCCMCPSVRL